MSSLAASADDGFLGRDDVDKYVELACSGTLYESLMRETGLCREDVKKRFLVDVLNLKERYPSVTRNAFQRLFPSIHALIEHMNMNNRCNLIRRLQQLESWLVIENVAPRLVDLCPIVTLHDAVFCRDRDLVIVQEAFLEAFAELGFSIRLKVEHCHREVRLAA